MIEQVLIDEEKWLDFWTYFNGEPGQVDGVKKLYEHIKVASPTLLARNAEWMEIYRNNVTAPDPGGSTPEPDSKPAWPLTKAE